MSFWVRHQLCHGMFFLTKVIDLGVSLGSKLLIALVVFLVGRWIVKKLNRLLVTILEKRKVEASLSSFCESLVSITLTFVVDHRGDQGCLGIETSSFIALVCICRCRYRYGVERYVAKFCGRCDDFVVQAV